ncbi:MAG: hypothetical protein ACRD3W_31265, partial [Terriglobales bacterium]
MAADADAESVLGRIGSSPIAHQMVGATVYEGLRDPAPGESRLGNMITAGGAMFIFGKAGEMTQGLTGWSLLGARAATGAVAMAGSRTLADGITQGRLPTWSELGQSAATGALLNTVMPPLLSRIGSEPVRPAWSLNMAPELTPALRSTPFDQSPLQPAAARTVDGTPESGGDSSASTADGVPEGLTYKGTRTVTVIHGSTDGGPYADLADYRWRGQAFGSAPMQVYDLAGRPETEIIYPTAPADYPRLTLADTAKLIESTPAPSLIKSVTVYDTEHPDQAWQRQTTGNPSLTLLAEVKPTGEMSLFRPQAGTLTDDTAIHEWSHLHEQADPAADSAMSSASNLESLHSTSSTIQTGDAEVAPILSEKLLGSDQTISALTALNNPIRSAIWAQSMEDRLTSLGPESQGSMHDSYTQRVELIQRLSLPEAQSRL